MSNEYIIVGREVGEAKYFLHGDKSIDEERKPDGIPLTVAHIGKMMVEMSENGKMDEASPEYAQAVAEIKHALQVIDQNPGKLSGPDMEAIWENTTVELQWDERSSDGGVDKNSRILVVPADGSHTAKVARLKDAEDGLGFHPPLIYPLDVGLVLAEQLPLIMDAIRSYDPTSDDLKIDAAQSQAVQDHVRSELIKSFAIDDDETNPAFLSKKEVLEQSLVSYYRAVGIYITLMCK